MTKTIEERINSAINNGSTGSASLAELIRETEVEIEAASNTAETEHARALDIGCSDPAQAEAEARAEALKRDRLVPTLARLQDKLSAALTGERHARWLADFRRVEEGRDALGEEFADSIEGEPITTEQTLEMETYRRKFRETGN